MNTKQRLILLFDGTWNNVADNTNVYKLSCLIPEYDEEIYQRFFYDPGVGTKLSEKFLGGITGFGLSQNLMEGYDWLAKRYMEGDEVWIFGFSRGAYTARSLAGLIRKCGLVRTVTPKLLQEAEMLYRNKNIHPDSSETLAFRQKYSREIDIHFLGVWDTVGQLGIPGTIFTEKGKFTWHDTELSKIVKRAYHAIALDENREAYDVALWTDMNGDKKPEQIEVEQRWFIGAHANIGGGYKDDPLSNIPFTWMLDKAQDAGLKLNRFSRNENAWQTLPTDSFKLFLDGAYKIYKQIVEKGDGRFYRKYDKDYTNKPAVNISIDDSIWKLWKNNLKYRPQTLIRAGKNAPF